MGSITMILYVVFILGGMVFIFLAFKQTRDAKKATETWLSTPGEIVSSELSVHRSHSSKGVSTVNFKPELNYEYQVADQKFNGSQIGFGSAAYSKSKADKIIAPYPKGAKVTVYYDPSDPSKAVLETKAIGAMNFVALGIILITLGIIAILVFPR
jgi:hypothetical protein